MKNISKILFIIILTLLLTGCTEKTDFESQLVGTWYMEGNQEASFVLYDDGTCEITGEYGTGTWSVGNDNQFKLTNYYGESETAIIEKIENDKLVLTFGETKSTFSKSPVSIIEESVNESEEEIILETNSKKYQDNYRIQSVINPASHYDPFTIDSNDYFWVEAVSIDGEEQHRMLNINLDGEIFMDIPFVASQGISFVEDRYICSGNSAIYNFEGQDITDSFCSGNEEFIGVFQDTTGWTVWICESIDTYDSHEFVIKAKDLDGIVKAEWSKTELSNKYEEVNLSCEVDILGGSWYQTGNMILNVENKEDICRSGAYYCGADSNYLYLCFSDGWLSEDSIVLYDSQGDDVTPSFMLLENVSFWFDRYLGEGLMLLENHDGFVVIDANGKVPFDVNQFSPRGTWGDDKSINEFHSGKAHVEMKNESGVQFTTLIDNKGEFVFEPIKGTINFFYYENMWRYQYKVFRDEDGQSSHFLMDDAGNLIRNSGEVYIKEGEELTSFIAIENGELVVFPVEKID